MKKETIIRAWRDPEFRESLTSEERSALPECPAGQAITELDEEALARAVGGALAAFDGVDCMCSALTGPRTILTTRTTNTFTSVKQTSIVQFDQVAVLAR